MIDYANWRNTATNNWKIKYYKGLGTSSKQEAKEYFSNVNDMVRSYITIHEENLEIIDKEDTETMNLVKKAKKTKKTTKKKDEDEDDDSDDEEHIDINSIFEIATKYKNRTTEAITLAFEKNRSNDRKIWVKKKNNEVLDYSEEKVTIPDFINKEMILFSKDDCERSIPGLDGFKPSQRKILYTVLQRKFLTDSKELKVATLASLVSSDTAYHHGEMSLVGAIVKMAQDYVGANNINLLVPSGQFGSRAVNGDDAASPRYIYTYLESIAQALFKSIDNNVLEYAKDDNDNFVEPKLFSPILPTVLINGANGIGTGFRTSIPKYNPKDIINIFKARINNEEPDYDIKPWYKGFTGTVLKSNEPGVFLVYGKYQIIDETDKCTIQINELPIGSTFCKSLESYKKFLETMEKNKKIIDFTADIVSEPAVFTVTMEESYMDKLKKAKSIYSTFKLVAKVNTKNMYLYDANDEINRNHYIL